MVSLEAALDFYTQRLWSWLEFTNTITTRGDCGWCRCRQLWDSIWKDYRVDLQLLYSMTTGIDGGIDIDSFGFRHETTMELTSIWYMQRIELTSIWYMQWIELTSISYMQWIPLGIVVSDSFEFLNNDFRVAFNLLRRTKSFSEINLVYAMSTYGDRRFRQLWFISTEHHNRIESHLLCTRTTCTMYNDHLHV